MRIHIAAALVPLLAATACATAGRRGHTSPAPAAVATTSSLDAPATVPATPVRPVGLDPTDVADVPVDLTGPVPVARQWAALTALADIGPLSPARRRSLATLQLDPPPVPAWRGASGQTATYTEPAVLATGGGLVRYSTITTATTSGGLTYSTTHLLTVAEVTPSRWLITATTP